MKMDRTLPVIKAVDSALLVEDNEDVAYLIRFLLMREGFAVHIATKGRDAENFISKSSPTDIVITDLMLSDQNGTVVLAGVRLCRPVYFWKQYVATFSRCISSFLV